MIIFSPSSPVVVVIPKSHFPAPDVISDKSCMHSSTKAIMEHQSGQRGRKPGRKRGRTPKALTTHPIPTPSKAVEPLKFPKKRGPKPGSKVGGGCAWLSLGMCASMVLLGLFHSRNKHYRVCVLKPRRSSLKIGDTAQLIELAPSHCVCLELWFSMWGL